MVKLKLLTAHRAGITTLLIPSRYEPDLDDVPASVREAPTVHLVSDVDEVSSLALTPAVGSAAVAAQRQVQPALDPGTPASARSRFGIGRFDGTSDEP